MSRKGEHYSLSCVLIAALYLSSFLFCSLFSLTCHLQLLPLSISLTFLFLTVVPLRSTVTKLCLLSSYCYTEYFQYIFTAHVELCVMFIVQNPVNSICFCGILFSFWPSSLCRFSLSIKCCGFILIDGKVTVVKTVLKTFTYFNVMFLCL